MVGIVPISLQLTACCSGLLFRRRNKKEKESEAHSEGLSYSHYSQSTLFTHAPTDGFRLPRSDDLPSPLPQGKL
jgi:hypothetical protein